MLMLAAVANAGTVPGIDKEIAHLSKLEFGSGDTYFTELVKIMQKADKANDDVAKTRLLIHSPNF